jgi:hypothetical protein
VLVSVVFPGFAGMMCGVQRMSVSDVGVVPGFLVIARLVVFGRFQVMFGSVFVVFRGFAMMFRAFVSHGGFSLLVENLNNLQESTGRI